LIRGMPLSGPNGSSEWFAGSWAEHLKANENKSSATLVEIRESNLSDAGSIPAISTLSPLNGGFFLFLGVEEHLVAGSVATKHYQGEKKSPDCYPGDKSSRAGQQSWPKEKIIVLDEVKNLENLWTYVYEL